jgi:hypothetical protein
MKGTLMVVKHKTQRSGTVSIPGSVFKVGTDGVLSPEPSLEQRAYLGKFPSMFEMAEPKKPEPKKPEPKKPEPKKPEPAKAAPKKAARRGSK